MKKRLILLFLITLLVGCNKSDPEATQTEEITPTPGLATPVVQTTQTPDVEASAVDYLNSWKDSDFQAMYELLDTASQAVISEEEFSQLYHDFAVELALESLDYRILSSFIDPAQAQVAVSVEYNSRLIEGLSREIILMLTLTDGEWKIEWSKALIFPELAGENQLQLTRIVPSRGNIYDRNGSVIVAYAEAVSLGMKRVVLLFTPPTTPAGSAAIESLVSRAKDSQVMVYTILVSSPAFFNSTGAEVLKSLTAETNGNFFTFSGEEPLPDFISLFAPLRSTYLINYQSQIVTSGSHTLELTMSSDLGESQGQREFFLDVQPPNPIFISPPRVITRKMVQTGSDTLPISDFEPGSITLGLIVEFPDQHPRELEEVIFRVDGEVVSRLTEEPYDHFVWDLSQYENSAVHYLTIEAVDLLGLSKQSIQTPIEVIIDIPPQSISTILADNAPAFAGLALVLILGMLLFILISRGTIKPEFKFGLNRFFRNGGKEKNNTSQLKKINQDGEFIGSSGNPNSLEIKKQKAFRLIPISDVLQQQVPEPIQGGEDDVILGNDPSPGIINIPHPSVVKQHARITIQPDGEFVITDEGSPSGTWINYKQILSNKPHPLKDGDIIHIGEAGFRYQLMDKASDLPFTEEKTT